MFHLSAPFKCLSVPLESLTFTGDVLEDISDSGPSWGSSSISPWPNILHDTFGLGEEENLVLLKSVNQNMNIWGN